MSLLAVRHAADCAEGGGRCDCGALDRAIEVIAAVLRKWTPNAQRDEWWWATEIAHALNVVGGEALSPADQVTRIGLEAGLDD